MPEDGEKKFKITKEGEKGIKKSFGHNPKTQFQADQEKPSQDFKQKRKKAADRSNICFHQTLARKAEQRSARQSPAGVTGTSFLAWGSSPQAGQGNRLPAEELG